MNDKLFSKGDYNSKKKSTPQTWNHSSDTMHHFPLLWSRNGAEIVWSRRCKLFSVTEVNFKLSILWNKNRENIFTCLSFVLRGHETNMFCKPQHWYYSAWPPAICFSFLVCGIEGIRKQLRIKRNTVYRLIISCRNQNAANNRMAHEPQKKENK